MSIVKKVRRMDYKRKQKSKKVFILGEDTRSFLTVVRSLGRKGLDIHVGSNNFDEISLYSKYINEIHTLPSPKNADNWRKEVTKILKIQKFDLVIPTNDPNIILCQKYRYELEQYCRLYLLDENSYITTKDKMKTYTLARSLNINVPKSILVNNDINYTNILENFEFPIMLKPISSFDENNLLSKQYVKKINNEDELKLQLNSMLTTSPVLIQEYFNGIGVGLEILSHKGKILTKFQHIRIHEPRDGGGSTYRKSVSVDNQLLDSAKKIMAALNYTGVAMIEYKVDYEKNKWTLIEINGRFWGSLPLAVSSGIDFPYYLYQMIVEEKENFPQKYKENIYCRNTSSDLVWIKENFKEKKYKVVYELLNIMLLREKNDTLIIDDPTPGIIELCKVIQYLKIFTIRKTELKILNIPYLRLKNSKKIIRELSQAKKILFVCKGNICRSPFAEKYARKIFPPEVSIQSCGIYAQEGRKSPIEAIVTAKTFGVDLSEHRSITVTNEIIEKSDVILVFDWENMQKLMSKYPSHKKKVWYISELNPKCSLLISDPFGKDQKTFKDTYEKIVQNLNILKKGVIK